MRTLWRLLVAFLLDVADAIDPPCPARCGFYARGPRTLQEHLDINPGCRAAIHDSRQEASG